MENFIVSARKYRPARFEDVIGQPQVTQTLKNAIRNNQLAQAFLFCGPRGVGKTTCARILAKVINCENISKDIEACNECESCKSFNQNATFNVHELDAASNNSVEDIRALIEQIRYAPQTGKKKIYIIDEVHMLSNQAFNAFLKTLEEPPPYAIFILATTEKHKIIPTILSRCQIFDFSRIRTEDTADYLANIAKKEEIKSETDALHIIAQKSDGALRDALSMFDRISVFTGGNITYQSVLNNLNILDYDYFFRFTDYFLQESVTDCLLTYNEILANGFEGDNFLSGLASHIRSLLVSKDKVTLQLLETSANLRNRYFEQSAYTPVSFLLNALNIINDAEIQYRTSRNKRLCVELAMMKLCYLYRTVKFVQSGEQVMESKKKTDATTLKAEPAQSVSSTISTVTEKKEKYKTVTPSSSTTAKPTFAGVSGKGFKLPTLNDIKATVQQEKPEEVAIKNGTEKFIGDELDEDKLKFALSKYLEKLQAEKNFSVSEILKIYPPALENKRTVLIVVGTQSHYQLLIDERETMLNFLKQHLQKNKIDLTVRVDAERAKADNKKRPYTPTEKFEHMAKKNPLLRQLKDDLKLEADF
ncbi:MAG: DNA polymerase III subunit gamma/tau [Sphingobacteriales bacterium]|nr:MAG: DNA polymerase III subunit gamma/tau [Sphingobacteriales bacterium]